MRIFKKRFLKKATAIFLVLVIVESIVQPTLTYALTTGPHQPEYTSYEQPGATDMVNLLTGDFTFSLPIFEVPGPEGNFSVPLTYNAGIGPEQEASWVGLGWTMNVGAITREINQYPDDASGESQSIHNVNLNNTVHGWTSACLGLGQVGWNNVQGSYGALSLLGIINYQWDEHHSSGGLLGANVGNGKVDFNGAQFATGIATVALTIATLGAGTAAEAAGGSVAAQVGKQSAVALAEGAALSAAFSSQTPGVSASSGYWTLNQKLEKQGLFHKDYWLWLDDNRGENMYGVLNFQNTPENHFVLQNWYGTDNNHLGTLDGSTVNTTGNGLGSAYQYDNNKIGATSDVNYYIPPNKEYKDATSACLLAADNFTVKAPGIAGKIQPLRLEVGNVSMPLAMSDGHIRYNIIPYLNYKVPFVYDGINSSSYLFPTGTSSANFNFGLDFQTGGTWTSATSTPHSGDWHYFDYGNFILNDAQTFDAIGNPTVRSDININTNPRIPEANHVEWFSNQEVIDGTASSKGFMDYFASSTTPSLFARQQFRTISPLAGNQQSTQDFTGLKSSTFSTDGFIPKPLGPDFSTHFYAQQSVWLGGTWYENLNDQTAGINGHGLGSAYVTITSVDQQGGIHVVVPEAWKNHPFYTLEIKNDNSPKSSNGIAGYSITNASGLTYHFALPSYEHSLLTFVGDKTTPTTKYNTISRITPFANTWLLTGITGSDFIDRNANGVIDEGDWGYWVKFNYGNRSDTYQWWGDRYQWSIPYGVFVAPVGETNLPAGFGVYNVNQLSANQQAQPNMIDPDNTSVTSSSGRKQLYYLNSIETRSHVAIFIKDFRNDNYDAAMKNSSLCLSEIALLKREDYKSLFTAPYSQENDSGTITSLWMSNGFYPASGNTPVGDFIVQHALKRIQLKYDYSLCKLTPNSNDATADASNNAKGKLTLNRIKILGRNTAKVVPDYKFSYGNSNPTYDPNKWDGWGLYNSNGTSANSTHAASPLDADGSAWSLSQITTPVGSTINVSYERDSYSSISGSPPPAVSYSINSSSYYYVPSLGTTIVTIPDYSGGLYPGDVVSFVNGNMSYSCGGTPVSESISGNYQIQSVYSNYITLTSAFGKSNSCPGNGPTPISLTGSIQTVTRNVKGGGTRVSSIVLNDQSQTYKTRYLYLNNDGSSSGVVAQEAPYTKTSTLDFNTIPGYPMTPVMYSQVSVLNGNLSNDDDFHTKQVYQFETPNTNQIVFNNRIAFNGSVPNGQNSSLLSLDNEVQDFTSKLGSLNSIKTFEGHNPNPIVSTSLNYTNQILNGGGQNNYQGYYASSVMMHDRIFTDFNATHVKSTYKINRSTVIKYPNALQSVVTTKEGFTNKSDNIAWDFISGQVVEKNSTSALGIKTKTVIQPAYNYYSPSSNSYPYAQMGPKAGDPTNNKNMLTQVAAEYNYRLNALGDITGLISGQATAWNDTWSNYRDFNGVAYTESGGIPSKKVWRKNKTYAYQGSISDRQDDGSLAFNTSTNKFDLVSATNSGWLQTSEVKRYDHYSLPIEGQDPISKIYSGTKTDFNNKFILATASNANYYEFAYSGAEDWVNPNTFFGGEIALGGGTVVAGGHTGASAVQLAGANKSFIFKPYLLTAGRTYRAQVWANSTNGSIYYIVGGVEQSIPTSSISVTQVGSWFRVVVDNIPFSAAEIGVKATNGTAVNFDDFRFQPRDGSMQANVYDASTGYLTYTLGNDNLYTRYFYDDRGIVMKTYIESIKYNGERLVTERKDNYKRNNTNQ
jgi:hypothetical protein